MKLQNVKGSMDFLPEDQLIRNRVIKVLSDTFLEYGYLPVETTTLCYYDLLASKYAGGAEILKEVYKLKDQGERDLALRYDLTVPFAKVIAMNKGLNLPFRRYEIGKVYRDGPVKVGRNREFYQCDVDVCGIEGQLVEAELMSMAVNGYKRLGIDIYIEWNNRKFLSGIISWCGIEEGKISSVILSVDKLAKIGEDGVKNELKELNINEDILDNLFSCFKLSINELENKFSNCNNTLLKEGIEEIIKLDNYLVNLGLDNCIFTPYLARGLEIYTGTVWEVFDKNKNVTCAIGAGGRYDKIITNFINDGNTYPAVGMSFGLVPICEILNKVNNDSNDYLYDLYVVPMSENEDVEALKLANSLRNKGIRVIVEMKKRKVKKCMEWADKNKIPYVIVIGSDEVLSREVIVKDMISFNSNKCNLDNIEDIFNVIK